MDTYKLVIGLLALFLGIISLGSGIKVDDIALTLFGILSITGATVALAMARDNRKIELI